MPQQNTIETFGPIVRTTDATLTAVGYIRLFPSRVYQVWVSIVGLDQNLDQGASYIRIGSYVVNAAGVITLLGSVATTYTAETAGGWDATLDISSATTGAASGTGPYVRAVITGESGKNIVWRANFTITEIVSDVMSSGG